MGRAGRAGEAGEARQQDANMVCASRYTVRWLKKTSKQDVVASHSMIFDGVGMSNEGPNEGPHGLMASWPHPRTAAPPPSLRHKLGKHGFCRIVWLGSNRSGGRRNRSIDQSTFDLSRRWHPTGTWTVFSESGTVAMICCGMPACSYVELTRGTPVSCHDGTPVSCHAMSRSTHL